MGMGAVAVRQTWLSRAASAWVNHSHAVLSELKELVASAEALEGAHRGVVLTGMEVDLAVWRQAYASVAEHVSVVKALMATEPRHAAVVRELEGEVTRRLLFSRQVVEVRRARGMEAARSLLVADGAGPGVRKLRVLVAGVEHGENQLLLQRDRESTAQARATRRMVYLATTLNFVLLGVCFWVAWDDARVRRRHARFLEEANVVLEQRVRERTAELAKANADLEVENMERKWAHASLERSFRHSEQIIQTLSEAVVVVSRTGVILSANPAVHRLFGVGGEPLGGHSLSDYLSSVDEDGGNLEWAAGAPNLAMLQNRSVSASRARVRRQDGPVEPVTLNVHPVLDSGKVVAAIVGILPAAGPV